MCVHTGCKPLRLDPWADGIIVGNDLLSKEFFWPGCNPQAAMYVLEMTLIFSIRANWASNNNCNKNVANHIVRLSQSNTLVVLPCRNWQWFRWGLSNRSLLSPELRTLGRGHRTQGWRRKWRRRCCNPRCRDCHSPDCETGTVQLQT